jgi:hypothetical protein
MNQRDRANLEFLLNIGPGLANWYAQASAEDIEYATELLEAYEQELSEQEMNLLEEDYGVNLVSASTRVLQ